MSDWQPPQDNQSGGSGFDIGTERAPWLRWILSGLVIAAIVIGGIWLMTKVIVPDTVPNAPDAVVEASPDATPAEPIKRTSDDAAWIKALEMDTLEGYREYLTLFPTGNHKDDAQAEIDAYDNKAWDIAEQRRTIAGYEDYLLAWPEGLHASKAREKIAEMKARADAISKDATERAQQDLYDWEQAAKVNTVDAYGRYLTKHPAGKFADQAQSRIDNLRATAADKAAWDQAKAANRAESYQQYLDSFPKGAFVPDAMAAIEKLKPAVGRTFKDCDVCPTMVTLPTGTAQLGASDDDADSRPNEKPRRPVTFSKMFAMGVHEVTFSQWQACVSAGGCASVPNDNGWGQGSRPLINVSWDDAQTYAGWLSFKTGMQYVIPSEAQWEYAARGGETDRFVGGSLTALCAFANGASKESGFAWANTDCTDPTRDRTQPVGLLGANKFGLKDMIGNVGEWTQDCNTLNLKDAPTDGAADQRGSCNQRVVRGGSWFSGPSDLRYAARLMQRRGDSNDFTGFRVARIIP